MTLERKEVVTHKWSMRAYRPSAIGNKVAEREIDIDHGKTFEKASTGYYFSPPANNVFDAETLRSVADHLDELNKDFVADAPEEKAEGSKPVKQSFTIGH